MDDSAHRRQLREVRATLERLQNTSDQALKTISQARDRVREALAAIHAGLCEPDISAHQRADLHDDLNTMHAKLAFLDEKRVEVGASRGEAAKYDAILDDLPGGRARE